jgi:hypothetical protein
MQHVLLTVGIDNVESVLPDNGSEYTIALQCLVGIGGQVATRTQHLREGPQLDLERMVQSKT